MKYLFIFIGIFIFTNEVTARVFKEKQTVRTEASTSIYDKAFSRILEMTEKCSQLSDYSKYIQCSSHFIDHRLSKFGNNRLNEWLFNDKSIKFIRLCTNEELEKVPLHHDQIIICYDGENLSTGMILLNQQLKITNARKMN